MANLLISNDQLLLKMTFLEQIGSFHSPVKMPISEVTSFEYVTNPWKSNVMRGLRAPGTGFPYLIMLGTLRNFRGWKAFCAIYKRKPVIVVNWKSGPFSQWIVTSSEADYLSLKEKIKSDS